MSKNYQGSVFGATMLIAGCCVGAGMLGMPVLTRPAGFLPSVVVFFLSWLFMTLAGLVLMEVALWFDEDVNLAGMAKKYLGRVGEWATVILMLFLMYALMTAYTAGLGQLVSDFVEGHWSFKVHPQVFSFVFIVFLFGTLALGTKILDYSNRWLMLGLAVCYILLVFVAWEHVKVENLQERNWKSALFISPIMVISFGFHNLIPSMAKYLGRDRAKLRLSIVLGALIPLGIYLLWEYLILGLIAPSQDVEGAEMTTELLKMAAGGLTYVIDLADAFSFFAITTSFLGIALSILDFLGDGLKKQRVAIPRSLLVLLTVVPPFIFQIMNPHIFLAALNFAGGFAAVLLFGMIPALMALRGQKEHELRLPFKNGILFFLILGSLTVIILSHLENFI